MKLHFDNFSVSADCLYCQPRPTAVACWWKLTFLWTIPILDFLDYFWRAITSPTIVQSFFLRRPSKRHSSQKHFFFSGHENFFRQIDPKSKISYITPLLIYKKIFFSDQFDDIFVNKVGFRKFWLVWRVRKKILIFYPRSPKSKISYISPLLIYKKIFFSDQFDDIFVNKVDFRKFARLQLC